MTGILDRNRPCDPPQGRLGITRGPWGRSGSPEATDGVGEWRILHRVTRAVGAAGSVLAFFLAWRLSRRQTIRRHRTQASRVRLRASQADLGRGRLEVTNDSDQPVHAALVRPVRIRTERSRRTAWLSRETTLIVEHSITIDRTLWPPARPSQSPQRHSTTRRSSTSALPRDAAGCATCTGTSARSLVSGRWTLVVIPSPGFVVRRGPDVVEGWRRPLGIHDCPRRRSMCE